jgi:hypothetical protein
VAINAAASSWAAIITFLSKGAEVTLLVTYALTTVFWVVRSKAEAIGDQANENITGTIKRRYEKTMALDN